jgi:lysine-specific demethylase 3
MYSSQASPEGMHRHGPTPLHMDMSDAINIMCSAWPKDKSASKPGAALWVIYPREATPYLREFLRKQAEKDQVAVDDPIHDQVWIREALTNVVIDNFLPFERPFI